MKWVELTLTVPRHIEEPIIAILTSLVPQGFAFNDDGEEILFSIHLSDSSKAQAFKRSIFEESLCYGIDSYLIDISEKSVQEKDWLNSWKEHFKTIRVGNRLVVRPSWEKGPAIKGNLIIEIDPGRAFGTGAHPTTKGCLMALEHYIKHDDIVVDVGTGSGILAIAAAKLGARRVVAIDIDPVAIETAKENARKNEVLDRVEFKQKDFRDIEVGEVDLVVANLDLKTILRLTSVINKGILNLKRLIISGLLSGQKRIAEGLLKDYDFRVNDFYQEEGWCTLVGEHEHS